MTATRSELDEARWSAWMREARAGNEHSYRQLLAALADCIEAWLRSRLGQVDYIEDIVQESLLAIHQARHSWQEDRPFRPWLFAIVRHKAIDTLRRCRSREQRELHPLPEPGEHGHPESHGAELVMESHEVFQGISPQFHQALVLTRIIGLTIREAAQKAGVSEVAMKVRVHRALGALSRQLQEVPG